MYSYFSDNTVYSITMFSTHNSDHYISMTLLPQNDTKLWYRIKIFCLAWSLYHCHYTLGLQRCNFVFNWCQPYNNTLFRTLKHKPIGLLICFLRYTSSALSNTRFMNSSKPYQIIMCTQTELPYITYNYNSFNSHAGPTVQPYTDPSSL